MDPDRILNTQRTEKSKMIKRIRTQAISIVFAVMATMFFFKTQGQQLTYISGDFYNGATLRIDFIKENVARIRILQRGNDLPASALNRYQFLNESPDLKSKPFFSKNKSLIKAQSASLNIEANIKTGAITVTDESSKELLLQTGFYLTKDQAKVFFQPLNKEENWVGFGDQTRQRLYHRGYLADCDIRDVHAYIPVPFFMSTDGVGVLVNTTYHTVFDMCKTNENQYSWQNSSGVIDYYIIRGHHFKEIIGEYTSLTGKPKLPPIWAFGLWYICRTQATDYEVINDAVNLRREKIPADVIGLEPGWMEKRYDYSVNKTWSKERFVMEDWIAKGNSNFVSALKRMGFKMELWLCNDYDLSYEEERRIGNDIAKSKSITKHPVSAHEANDKDEHLETGVVYMDKYTKKDEPWFEHLKKFVDQGASFFKQDGANQVLRHPDRLWGNGMTDMEMHNLYPLLYSRQMYEGLTKYTNKRAVVFTPAGWTGFQAYSGTWTGDTGGNLTTLGGMMNVALTGHSWSTVDMEVSSKEGIHFGYLSPWSQINSWTYYRMPWVQGNELLEMHQYYSRLRSAIIPYLYSWAYEATKTGYPLIAPLTLEFPEDKNCRDNLHQYLLGRDFLVGTFKNDNYFPDGEWKDYWTGEVVKGNQFKKVKWPKNRGGSLYIRLGAIIPFGPLMQYRGEKPVDSINLYIFPSEKKSSFSFYEDDGITFDYLNNKNVITPITAQRINHSIEVSIGLPSGAADGVVMNKRWSITVHATERPTSVSVNNKEIDNRQWSYDNIRNELKVDGLASGSLIIIR